uniref:Uncharacterized protein n=1 Tax=Rhabditophanes sp. KR3021 TaxID=114890 RepID=A0AC35U6S9_9BILA
MESVALDKLADSDGKNEWPVEAQKRIKKIKCIEMYVYLDRNGKEIKEQAIRELVPKIIKSNNKKKMEPKISILSSEKKFPNIFEDILPTIGAIKISPQKPLTQNRYAETALDKNLISENGIRRAPNRTLSNDYNQNSNYLNQPNIGYETSQSTYNYKHDQERNNYIDSVTPSPLVTSIIGEVKKVNGRSVLSNQNCFNMQTYVKGYGISDVRTFVRQNCHLAKMFMPQYTCEEINMFVDSCFQRRMFH